MKKKKYPVRFFSASYSLMILGMMVFSQFIQAQDKFEKETRIQLEEVPQSAISFVEAMGLDSKVKWYREEGLTTSSYEAKTKFNGEWLSIEFSENGTFEDLEIEMEWPDIHEVVRDEIMDHLEEQYSNFSIRKVQIQYSGNDEKVISFFHDRDEGDVTVNYEVVISARVDGSYQMYEYLFDDDGEFIRRSRIILKMTDNIEY